MPDSVSVASRLFYLFCLILPAFTVWADEPTKMEEIQQEISRSEEEANGLRTKVKELEQEQSSYEQLVRGINGKIASVQKDLVKVKESRLQAEILIRETEDKIQAVEKLSQKRLRALYISDRTGEGALFQRADRWDRGALYLKKIRVSDLGLVENLRLLRSTRDTENGKLGAIHQKQTAMVASLELQKRDLQEKLLERKKASEELQQQKKALDEVLIRLKAQSLRLETALRELSGGEATGGNGQESVKNEAQSSDAEDNGSGGAFDGLGLKAKIPLPIDGRIVSNFGRYRDPAQKGQFLERKGVEIRGTGSVKVVEAGKIVHIGPMPKLETVVVVDHGSRDYTLYGGLKSVWVKKGGVLSQGEEIGELSGDRLYFEVRVKGQPVNPAQYFRKKG